MPTTLPNGRASPAHITQASAASALAGATLFLAIVLFVVTAVAPRALVLPALGVGAMLGGLILASAAALRDGRHSTRSTRTTRDVAALLVLFGFTATMTSDKSEAIRALSAVSQPAPISGELDTGP